MFRAIHVPPSCLYIMRFIPHIFIIGQPLTTLVAFVSSRFILLYSVHGIQKGKGERLVYGRQDTHVACHGIGRRVEGWTNVSLFLCSQMLLRNIRRSSVLKSDGLRSLFAGCCSYHIAASCLAQ